MDVSLSSDVLDQLVIPELKVLQDCANKLSNCGVDTIADVPQIVVLGEQSSGKSSVLEAICHVQFTTDSPSYTQFATELILHPAEKVYVDVSIRFANKLKLPKSFHITGFRDGDLPRIINRAKEYMDFDDSESKKFSKDVLRVEIHAPSLNHLKLVDLPGLIFSPTESNSSDGTHITEKVVDGYIQQKNSVILAVTRYGDLDGGLALARAKQVDPQGLRTIGIITKPDLMHLPSAGGEGSFLRNLKNQDAAIKLYYGWHVLRSTTLGLTGLGQRDEAEKEFFEAKPWASVHGCHCGIKSLRKKLSHLLYTHVRDSLPVAIDHIERSMRERQEELQRLGKPRSTQEDKQLFLLTLASDFQRLARDAIDGRYGDSFFGGLDDEERKLRAQVRNLNRTFDFVLKMQGSTWDIRPRKAPSGHSSGLDIIGGANQFNDFIMKHSYHFPFPHVFPRDKFKEELQKKAVTNQARGFLGSADNDLVIQLFKKQAEPWEKIAEFHINRITLITKVLVDAIFLHLIGPSEVSRTTDAILAAFVDPFFEERRKVLQEKLQELLKPYQEGFGVALDSEFHQSYSQNSMDVLADRVHSILRQRHPSVFGPMPTQKLEAEWIRSAISSAQPSKDDEFATDATLDTMMVYYDMSRRTFTDNVINLAIESCLIRHIPEILSPAIVNGMSMEKVQELATESDTSIARRQVLQEELVLLQQCLSQYRRYRPRPATVVPVKTPTTQTKNSNGKPRAQLEKSFENGPQQAPPDVPLPARNLPTPAIHSAAQFPTIPSTMANAASQPAPVSPFGCPPGQPSVKPAPLFSLSPETGDVPFGSHTSQTTSAGQIFGRSPASQAGVIGNRNLDPPTSARQIYDQARTYPYCEEKENMQDRLQYVQRPQGDDRIVIPSMEAVNRYHHICFQWGMDGFSPEELRLEHMKRMKA